MGDGAADGGAVGGGAANGGAGGAAPPVLVSQDGEVGYLTLNRPAAMNAVTVGLATALHDGLTELAAAASVIVVRGAGGNFGVGGDFHEVDRLRQEGPDALWTLFTAYGAALEVIATLPVPVIAAVQGYALAGGFELMQACDIALVSDTARIADNHVRFGQIPGGGGSVRLPRLVGRQRALAHMLTGDRLDGPTAVAWGLAYACYPAADFDREVGAFATALAGRDATARGIIKRLVIDGLAAPAADALAAERRAMVDHLGGASAAGGISSFKERS